MSKGITLDAGGLIALERIVASAAPSSGHDLLGMQMDVDVAMTRTGVIDINSVRTVSLAT